MLELRTLYILDPPASGKGFRGHMRRSLLIKERTRLLLGVLLTVAAGWVDAVGYLRLQGIYLSFMTGNTITIGVSAAVGHWPVAVAGALLVAFFLTGTVAGTLVAEAAGAWSVPATLTLGSCLLGASVGLSLGGWKPSYALAPAVFAMGVQNVALPPLGGVRLGATFITGTLVSVGQGIGRALLGKSDGWEWGRHALVWAGLVTGATTGALWMQWTHLDALLPPTILIATLALASAMVIAIERRRESSPRQDADGGTVATRTADGYPRCGTLVASSADRTSAR